MDREYVYYFPLTDHISVVEADAHNNFSKWLISKHGASVGDFWWEDKTRETIVEELLSLYEKDVVFLGVL